MESEDTEALNKGLFCHFYIRIATACHHVHLMRRDAFLLM